MKRRNIIGLIIAIGIISTLLIIIANTTKTNTSHPPDTEDKDLRIFQDLQEVSSFRVLANETVTATKEGDRWKVENTPKEVEQERVEAFVTTMEQLRGSEANVTKKDVYLDFPKVTVELVDKDGMEQRFSVGSLHRNQTHYYMEHLETKTIYMVNRQDIETIPLKPEDLINRRIVQIPIDELEEIIIDNGTEEMTLRRDAPLTEEEKIAHISGWYLWDPYEGVYSVSFQAMEDIYQGIPQLTFSEIVKEEKETGIKDANFRITWKSPTEEETLYIGDPATNQHYYVAKEGSDEVMTVRTELLDPFSKRSFDMMDKFVHLVALDVLKELSIDTVEQSYQIEVDNHGEGLAVTINGESVKEEQFRQVYLSLAGISFDTFVKKPIVTEEAEVTLEYTVLTEEKGELTETIEFIPMQDDTYFVQKDQGASEFSVKRDKVKEALEQMKQLLE